MLNPEVLKCHEDIITLDTYVQQGKTMVTMAGDNKFYIYRLLMKLIVFRVKAFIFICWGNW